MNMFRAFMELDEAYNNRQSLIDDIKKAGKNYNFDKYTNAQLYCIWQRLQKPVITSKEPKHELDLDFGLDSEFNYCDSCGERLTDFSQCPVCDFGEEDLDEGIFDKPSNLHSWKSATGAPVNISQIPAAQNTTASSSVQNAPSTSNKYIVKIVFHGGRLRALATDGVNPAAFVAFPNNLRQREGQTYEVDQLIWNGKNYRVAGNIVEI